MTDFRTGSDLARHQRERARRMAQSFSLEHAELVDEMKAEATRLVSGGIDKKTLAQAGYPFSTRRAFGSRMKRVGLAGAFPLTPINIQTGELLKSLRVITQSAAGAIIRRLQFSSKHAEVLLPGGLRNMVDRKFWDALRDVYHQRKTRLAAALRRSAH